MSVSTHEQVTANAAPYVCIEIEAPPVKNYPTYKDAHSDMNKFGALKGYALVILHSIPDKSKMTRRALFACDRHGNPPKIPNTTERNSSSRKCNCPMRINVVRFADNTWTIEYRGLESTHNHDPSTSSASHPKYRSQTRGEAVRLQIAVDAEIGLKASQIYAKLVRKHPDLVITRKDIYNEIAKVREGLLGGKAPIEYLFSKLDHNKFWFRAKQDPKLRLTHLFIAHPASIKIYKDHPDVLIMDCTYKTNRYNMPLFNIIGVTGMNTTIHVAQVYLRKEKKPDFVWVLQILRDSMAENAIENR